MFIIVYGIHCNYLIVLLIGLKTCRSNVFFLIQVFSGIGKTVEKLECIPCTVMNTSVLEYFDGRVSEVLLARSASGAQFIQALLSCTKWPYDLTVCVVSLLRSLNMTTAEFTLSQL